MKFIALLKNDLKTAMPWILLVIVLVIFIALPMLKMYSNQEMRHPNRMNLPAPGQEINQWSLFQYPALIILGPSLFIVSLALGIILGVRHFYVPFFTKTWQFTLHRSVTRLTVLSSKFTAATIAFVIALLIPWSIIFAASQNNMFPIPPSFGVFLQGCLFILTGLVAYLAVAASAISTTRWYTTKMFPLGFAFLGICPVFSTSSLITALIFVLLVSAIIKIQLIHNFMTRQF